MAFANLQVFSARAMREHYCQLVDNTLLLFPATVFTKSWDEMHHGLQDLLMQDPLFWTVDAWESWVEPFIGEWRSIPELKNLISGSHLY